MQQHQLDFLAVGDITTDAFIRLKDAHINCSVDNARCELCMRFADKIPYEFVEVVRAVGNSPNAAVAAARLGLSAGLVTNIGDDENGRECVAVLKKEKVDTHLVSTHKGAKTNYHYVLWFEDERTILVKHEEYPYQLPAIEPAPKWLYLSSLGGNSEPYHYEITAYLKTHPEVRLAFQPGTFQIRLGKEKLAALYEQSDLFFCNKEEARRVVGASDNNNNDNNDDDNNDDIKNLLSGIHALGPKIVCITDGPKGAYALDTTAGSNEYWFQPPYPDPKPPLNRTGAGDAFASTFTAAIILGKPVPVALQWAPINSCFVVQQIGAQRGLLSREQLEKYLATAPDNYKPRRI